MKTVDELAKEKGLKSYDTALPQPWVDSAKEAGHDVLGHFVWSYDGAGVFGEPVALTSEGRAMLRAIKGS